MFENNFVAQELHRNRVERFTRGRRTPLQVVREIINESRSEKKDKARK